MFLSCLQESFVEGAVAARRQQLNGGSTSAFGKKRLVHSSCACLRKGVEILGRRLKVKSEGS
jgi:hypothetical protein